MKTANHMPIPWHLHRDNISVVCMDDLGSSAGCDLSNRAACITRDREVGIANAAFIVKCVNNHDALVEALKAVVDDYSADTPDMNGCEEPSLDKARAVLAAMESAS